MGDPGMLCWGRQDRTCEDQAEPARLAPTCYWLTFPSPQMSRLGGLTARVVQLLEALERGGSAAGARTSTSSALGGVGGPADHRTRDLHSVRLSMEGGQELQPSQLAALLQPPRLYRWARRTHARMLCLHHCFCHERHCCARAEAARELPQKPFRTATMHAADLPSATSLGVQPCSCLGGAVELEASVHRLGPDLVHEARAIFSDAPASGEVSPARALRGGGWAAACAARIAAHRQVGSCSKHSAFIPPPPLPRRSSWRALPSSLPRAA